MSMLYVERDGAGAIVGVYRHPQPGFAEEELGEDHPALAASGPAWNVLRLERNRRLADSDWTQGPDTPLVEEERAGWANYRQLLRMLPQVIDSPADFAWPLPPEARP